MIGRIYRLMDAKRIEMIQREVSFNNEDEILVKPDFMSICAADKRYFFGKRHLEILSSKLPLALIHEATATVLYDKSGKLPTDSKVVLMPLIDEGQNSGIKTNYNPENQFMSSDIDGFMRDFIAVPHNRVIHVPDNYSAIYVFSEMVSVVINMLDAFEKSRVTAVQTVGVWGDGSMGYVVSLVLRCLYPNIKIIVFGKNLRKLQRFSFVNKTYNINEVPPSLNVDHCFECVGGKSSEAAVEQILNVINPQGCVSLLGVSEEAVSVSTRIVLEKGLKLIGNNRSDSEDFRKAVALIRDNEICKKYLEILISERIAVKNERDMAYAFEQSSINDFKTVIKWEV
jgi:ribitol-5-phosphate 2-dehydrogenase